MPNLTLDLPEPKFDVHTKDYASEARHRNLQVIFNSLEKLGMDIEEFVNTFPFLDPTGEYIESEYPSGTTTNDFDHTLGRTPVGLIVTRFEGNAYVYVKLEGASDPTTQVRVRLGSTISTAQPFHFWLF